MHDHHSARRSRIPGNTEETLSYTQSMAPSQSLSSPSRQHSEESWVEIESRASSASLSSAADEIITTGLTVQHDSNLHRRPRRARGGGQFSIGTGHRVANIGGNSSQEEYDESESESDRVMTSSNEGIAPSPLRQEHRRPKSVASSETMSEREGDDEDDDENATAVNYPRSRRQFEPRPNAFSHPSAQHTIRSQSGTISTSRRNQVRPSASARQHSYPQHTPYSVVAPGYQPDHDEALRASLSTLLTAAAAVRGMPKPGQPRSAPPSSSRIDPASLRLVPESVALGAVPEESSSGPSSPRTSSSSPSDKSKRNSAPATSSTRSSSKDRRAVKKARKVGPGVEEISPTLMTWVVSAGVVVLVSAIGFSAGYVVGKESGYAEAMGQLGAGGADAGGCAREAASGMRGTGLGLRKLRWAGSGGIRV